MVVMSRHLLPACIVRSVLDKLEIELSLAARRRTLSRPQEEQLERSLFRLAAAAAGKKGAAAPATRLLDASGLPLAPDLRAVDAWAEAATLEVGEDEQFAVLFDPPEVESLELPWAPTVGVPLLPRVSCRCCEPADVEVHWERRAGEASWETVGRGESYVPTEADVGHELRVTATPPSPGALVADAPAAADGAPPAGAPPAPSCLERLRQEVLLAAAAAPPPRPQLRERIAALDAAQAQGGGGGGGRFRVLSYNLLADAHRRRWDDPADGIHTYCDPALTAAPRRLPRLLAEVLAFEADVLCLQEVDRAWWDVFWRPQLRAAGYEATFASKRNKDSQEGIAVAVRAGAFELAEVREVPLSLRPPPPALAELLAAQPRTADGAAALPTVGQLLLLRATGGEGGEGGDAAARGAARTVLLAHTHLYFANPAVHVRLMQTAALLHAAEEWRDALPQRPALLVAGDLNSDATDGALHLLTRGAVPAAHRDWLLGRLTWAPSAGLDEAASRAAAEATARAAEEAARAAEAAARAALDPLASAAPAVIPANAAAAADAAAAAPPQPGGGGGGGGGGVADAAGAAGAAGADALAAAEELALSWHRLRKALRVLHKATDRELTPLLGADAAARGALVAEAAAAGRTLLDSAVLAAAEAAEQMRGEAAAAAEQEEEAAAEQEEEEGGAPRGAGAPSVAWLLSPAGKQASLRRLARLDAQIAALTTRGPAPVDDEAAAAEAETAPLPTVPLAAAVGTPLSIATPLRSAYGVHTRPTHATVGYLNALDWIAFEPGPLRLVGVAPLPPTSELVRCTALPSAEYPSDHVSLACDVEWA